MKAVTDLDALHALYGTPAEPAVRKVTSRLTTSYREWIERSRFCVLSTVGPEGTDGTPRGDDGPVVHIQDDRTLLMPDWRGNNRIDALRNIVRDGRVSLLFLIAGCTVAMRVNGTAIVTIDPEITAKFGKDGKTPRSVVVIKVAEVYSQCARALVRSGLWSMGDQSTGLPTVGQMLQEITEGEIESKTYDEGWPERASKTMW
ncbi:pyridoxamine 5'-phosphate oxidase family protein [Thioclava sp. FR2]|uniref:pyridoxamine 5'-phosphate oxidase family protein n=1 Tax=Thioclava sp. FR2 TaxID=3445780 RepID=UPI003EBB82C5